ncbi:BLUF domain-containing protein [Variovorax sp. ZS18.2.2]|uniref:BLUF domain-containing protein n=1 Tax=Variovorax sp. ZS18.2.2 TaxID=2971255 RepID=UPI002151B1F4|nr:BLUF domain-containing protein [Variovorax sp. ZS18.2.2]MCR6478143.1 BLUF domain-containing protein [Variovorax sp. ZS18.2.2]
MTEEQTLHEIFYCSVLAQDLPAHAVGAIVGQARARNAERNITGLLVFDGLRFCQHLEGPRDAVEALMRRIAQDPRHTDVRVVHEGPLETRRYSGFGMGLAESEGPDLMAGVHALEGEAALKHFLALRSSFDISG